MSKYQKDLETCREYADEVESGSEVAQGAVGGALLGGAVGAILGDRNSAERLAGVGAVTGGARGGSNASHSKSQVVKNCLRGRGYRVLN